MVQPDVMERTTVTRVLVVRHERIAGALEELEGAADVCLVAAVSTVAEATGLLEDRDVAASVDVVVVDLDGTDQGDEANVTRRLREAAPDAKVVLRGPDLEPGRIAESLAAGACGYLVMPRLDDDLRDVVRRAAAGELLLPERHLAPVLTHLRRGRGRSGDDVVLERLTPRETEILKALANGRTVTEIADRLGISALTVQTHLKSILAKLGVHSKIQAVTLAWRHGLAPSSRSA